MNEKELEEWIKSNPIKANAILPTGIVLGAVTMQAGLIALINWMLYIHSF